ncbi:MAG: DUF3488 and transglutaminase-like domain-containing protein, partial [Gammaproteobacteria bacterium]
INRTTPHDQGRDMSRLAERISPAQASLLLASTLVILPFLVHLPLWIGIVSLGFILSRALYDFGYHSLPGKWLRLVLIALTLAGILLQYKSALGRQPGASLIIMLMCLKLLELQGPRDERVVVYLGFFIVAVGFLFNQSLWMGMYLLLVSFALTLALLLQSHDLAREKNRFALLRLHAWRVGRMLLLALPVTVLLFVFFPRLAAPLWGLPEDAFGARSGLSETMAPGEVSQLSQDHGIAFRVEFDGPPPPQHQLYWRALVLNHYDGWQWRQHLNQTLPFASDSVVPLSAVVTYSVMLEPHPRNWLFVLDKPLGEDLPGSLDSLGQLRLHETVKQTRRYRMQAVIDYLDTGARPDSSSVYLPRATAPRASALAQTWRAQASSVDEVVNQALAFFRREEFFYSLQPPLLFDDPVDEFLFDTRKGYCEHYASAFTVLMRAAGIPARVVIGYQGGEYNAVDNYFIVRQSDAHAWAEVWYPDRGWQRVDPTAVIPLSRIEVNPVQLRLRPEAQQQSLAQQSRLQQWLSGGGLYLDALNYRWKRWVVGYNYRQQLGVYAEFRWDRLGPYGLGLMMLLLFALAYAIILMPWARLRRPPRDPAVRLYARFCHKMARAGLAHHDWEGAEEYSRRILQARPELARPVKRITWLYQRLHYGRTANRHNLVELEALIKAL